MDERTEYLHRIHKCLKNRLNYLKGEEQAIRRRIQIEEEERARIKAEKDKEEGKGCFMALLWIIGISLLVRWIMSFFS